MKTNTRNWKKTAGILVIVAALTIGTGAMIATAQPGFGRGPGAGAPGDRFGQGPAGFRGMQGEWWSNPKAIEKLELSEEQQELLSELSAAHKKEQIEKKATIDSLAVDLKQMWQADELDKNGILRTTSKIANLKADAEIARTKHRLEVAGVLTAEQQGKIREFLQQAREKVRQGAREGLRERREQRQMRDPDSRGSRRSGWQQDQPPAGATE